LDILSYNIVITKLKEIYSAKRNILTIKAIAEYMSKYKYYFKKPTSEITKDIFKCLATPIVAYYTEASRFAIFDLIKAFKKEKEWKKYNNKAIYNKFHYLKKKRLINIERKNHQIYISLTKEGKKKAGWMQIDDLKIKRPKKWDGKWRAVIFDIAQLRKTERDIFRGKLKELGFHSLQKSVWICPYNCKDEINLMRDFLGLSKKEVRLLVVEDMEDNGYLQNIFKLQ
jgi:DNA-binding PadR family transcriptional regulator